MKWRIVKPVLAALLLAAATAGLVDPELVGELLYGLAGQPA